jgi:hypothetical protein
MRSLRSLPLWILAPMMFIAGVCGFCSDSWRCHDTVLLRRVIGTLTCVGAENA